MDRRQLITGLISFVAAPAIVRASSLMAVKSIEPFCERAIFVSGHDQWGNRVTEMLMQSMRLTRERIAANFFNGIYGPS